MLGVFCSQSIMEMNVDESELIVKGQVVCV